MRLDCHLFHCRSNNSTPTGADPIPLQPEPKEYTGAGGGGGASGFPLSGSGGPTCWPVPPSGAMTITGAGNIRLDGKEITFLIIGSGATKKEFAWKASPPAPNPPRKKKHPPTGWSCSGGAELEKGHSYSVSVGFQNTTSPCFATTTVGKPSAVNGGVVVWNDPPEYTSATIYLPRIKTTTAMPAPSNPNNWRKTIGVGEIVACTLEGAPPDCSVTWALSGGGPHSTLQGEGYSAAFTAGDEAGGVGIVASFSGTVFGQPVFGSASVALTIVEPSEETAEKEEGWSYPSGRFGAGMALIITVHPTNVCFSRVEATEVSGPASNLTGLFAARYPSPEEDPVPTWHQASGWKTLNALNMWADDVSFEDEDPPWAPGAIEWDIPVRWKVLQIPQEHTLPNRLQRFEILDTLGTLNISKLGQEEQRAP